MYGITSNKHETSSQIMAVPSEVKNINTVSSQF